MHFVYSDSRQHFFTALFFFSVLIARAEVIEVNSQVTFDDALAVSDPQDTIVWQDGTYQDIYMNIQSSNLVIMAKTPGAVKFKGLSWAVVKGDYVTLSGFQFLDGNIGTKNVLESFGSYNTFDNINISGYTSYKYLVIRAECRYNKVSHCNFENRLNLDDKNILSVLVDANEPGYHLIEYCSFKNFDGIGKDQGIEPIRIGLSTQGEFISRTVVEYCYFTQCNGDGEIISNKARQNVFRYNTFKDNPVAELTLRHGDEAVVYGNFFLNGMGGVRIKEGQNHVVFNNYFSGLSNYSINLQNYNVDPLDDILIAFNTFVNTARIRLGGAGEYPPQGVTFANNVFSTSGNDIFFDPTGTESWLGNIYQGSLGIVPVTGLLETDPKLEENTEGFYSPSSASPVIDAAQEGYPDLPIYEGLEIDNDILLDLMKGNRPQIITDKDIGATEVTTAPIVQPLATEGNTGPTYLRQKYKLTVDPQGLGQILIEPEQSEYDRGTKVTITAVPIEGYEFYFWSGDKASLANPDTLIMNEDRHLTANFRSLVTAIEVDTRMNLLIYPNPVEQSFKLEFPGKNNTEYKLNLFDSQGIKVMTLPCPAQNAGTQVIDVSGLPAGIYLVRLEDVKGEASYGSSARLIKR